MNSKNDSSDSSNRLLERFFTGLSEYAFDSQLGVTDTEQVTYVSNCSFGSRKPMHCTGFGS